MRTTRYVIAYSLLAIGLAGGAASVTVEAASAHRSFHRPSRPGWRQVCISPASKAGDWPLGGHDLSGTRDQSSEGLIGPGRAGSLRPAWSFYDGHASGASGLGFADFNGTPVEAGGCVYVGTGATTPSIANLFALDLGSGRVVWKRHIGGSSPALGGPVVGSLAVSGRTVIAMVNERGDGHSHGPYLVALDRSTGRSVWQSRPLITLPDYYSNATPVVADGLVIVGFSAGEGDPNGHGGFALLDARTGRLLKLTFTIPRSDWVGKDGERFGGGGIWTTPAVDPRAGYAYMGTGNPYSKKSEHPRTNAIIKVDIRPRSRSFGQIVASYKGNIDQSTQALYQASRPTCNAVPDIPIRNIQHSNPYIFGIQGLVDDSQGCAQLDLDFGAGANLFRDHQGRLIVGDLQKSGVYHAVYAASMKRAWISMIGASCNLCNGSSTAIDPSGKAIFADVSPGSLMSSITMDSGSLRWYTPIGDGAHYEPVSTADGVLYTVDNAGFLDVIRASDGQVITRRSLVADVGGDTMTIDSSGISIARHTVLVEAGSHIIAYRVPGAY